MQVLTPHISCIVSPSELQTAVDQGFGEIYVITPKGPYKRTRLTHGRTLLLKVDSVPGVTDTVQEEINFLPAGKVPYALFNDIINFFRAVMTVKKAEQEAMAHILWNPEAGYHIGIPTQSVSKASVRYDFDDVKQGDVIVVDIHSHNTMGAFFSGTDNNDDRRSICYSGVVGHLEKPEPMTVWRFNVGEVKKECKFSDIFDVEVATAEVSEEWLNKVTVGHSYFGGHHYPKTSGAPWDMTPRGPHFYQGGQGVARRESGANGAGSSNQASFGFLSHLPNANSSTHPDGPSDFEHALGVYTDASLWEDYEEMLGRQFPEMKQPAPPASTTSPGPAAVGHKLVLVPGVEDTEISNLNAGVKDFNRVKPRDLTDVDDADDDPVGFGSPGSEEYITCEYGPLAATAYEQIGIYLQDLEKVDELLMDLLRDVYDMLSESAQAKIQTHGF